MNQIEQNIVESFRRAKNDIIKLQSEVIQLSQTQERLVEMLNKKTSTKVIKKIVKQPKKVVKRAKLHYVASKEGKKYHKPNCFFAQNIKPKSKLHFHSTTKAMNQGYKPCSCAK